MSAFSDYLEAALLDHIFNTPAFGQPATFAALFTTATTDAGGGTEVANLNGYARVQVNVNGGASPTWTLAAVDGIGFKVENLQAIDFAAAAGGAWGTITHVAIVDNGAYGAGNFLYHGALNASVVINDGSQFSFPIANLKCRTE